MKRGTLAALVGLSLAGAAWAQEPVLTWNFIGATGGSAMGWAMKAPASNDKLPQFVLVVDDRSPGRPHTAQVATLEIDCAKKTARPLTLDTYDTLFAKTASRTGTTGHAPFAGSQIATFGDVCTSRSDKTFQGNVAQALVWLDDLHPAKEPTPPGGKLSFERAGIGNDVQDIHVWLETTSIKRDGAQATAWVFDVWYNGWATSNGRYSYSTPITWRRYAIDCGAKQSITNTWFAQYSPTMARGKTQYTSGSDSSADVTYKQIMLRVCNNRPMLFSKTYHGDTSDLLAANYIGAAAALKSSTKFQQDSPPQRVDLGDTIRITERDGGRIYVSTLTRNGAGSNLYDGVTSLADGSNKFRTEVMVRGVSNGMLVLERSGAIKGDWAIPVADGKPTGKGIAYWKRVDDKYSWTLDEPVTIAGMTPPAPTAFQLPASVKFREASTKAGEGVYEATWTRRGTSNIYDGAWTYLPTGEKFADVLEVRGVENGKLIVYRRGNKGTYAIPVANGKTGRGTASWVSDPAFYVELVN